MDIYTYTSLVQQNVFESIRHNLDGMGFAANLSIIGKEYPAKFGERMSEPVYASICNTIAKIVDENMSSALKPDITCLLEQARATSGLPYLGIVNFIFDQYQVVEDMKSFIYETLLRRIAPQLIAVSKSSGQLISDTDSAIRRFSEYLNLSDSSRAVMLAKLVACYEDLFSVNNVELINNMIKAWEQVEGFDERLDNETIELAQTYRSHGDIANYSLLFSSIGALICDGSVTAQRLYPYAMAAFHRLGTAPLKAEGNLNHKKVCTFLNKYFMGVDGWTQNETDEIFASRGDGSVTHYFVSGSGTALFSMLDEVGLNIEVIEMATENNDLTHGYIVTTTYSAAEILLTGLAKAVKLPSGFNRKECIDADKSLTRTVHGEHINMDIKLADGINMGFLAEDPRGIRFDTLHPSDTATLSHYFNFAIYENNIPTFTTNAASLKTDTDVKSVNNDIEPETDINQAWLAAYGCENIRMVGYSMSTIKEMLLSSDEYLRLASKVGLFDSLEIIRGDNGTVLIVTYDHETVIINL